MTRFVVGDLVRHTREGKSALWRDTTFSVILAWLNENELLFVTGANEKYTKSGDIVMWRVLSARGLGWVSGDIITLVQRPDTV